MLVIGELMAIVGVVALVCLVWAYKRRRASRDPVSRLLRTRELREIDAHLDRIAVSEVRRLEASVVRYVAGEVGHVVVVWESPHGIALGLSDGRRLAIGVVGHPTLTLLRNRSAHDRLRPARVLRHGRSYRLLLRGDTGAELEVSTRRLVLAP